MYTTLRKIWLEELFSTYRNQYPNKRLCGGSMYWRRIMSARVTTYSLFLPKPVTKACRVLHRMRSANRWCVARPVDGVMFFACIA